MVRIKSKTLIVIISLLVLILIVPSVLSVPNSWTGSTADYNKYMSYVNSSIAAWNFNYSAGINTNYTDISGHNRQLKRYEGTNLSSSECMQDKCWTSNETVIDANSDMEDKGQPRIIQSHTQDISYSGWIQFNSCAANYRSALGQTEAFWIQADSDCSTFQATSRRTSYYNNPFPDPYTAGKWYFFAMKDNGSHTCLSVDNGAYSCATVSGNFNSLTNDFRVGAGGDTPHNLVVDELMVFNYSLSAQNISDLYCLTNSSCTLTADGGSPTGNYAPVVNLTFDSESNPWYDYAANINYSVQGSVSWENKTYGKYKGCINLSVTDASDYIYSTSTFNLKDGIAVSFWIYPNEDPDGTPNMGYMSLGIDTSQRIHFWDEGSYGLRTHHDCQEGTIEDSSSYSTEGNTWTHYFTQYNKSHRAVWKNGVLSESTSYNYGNLNHTLGDSIRIGTASGTNDLHGYMDEVLIWNRSNFSTSDVVAVYESKAEGTPPGLDLFVQNITYTLPFNYSHDNNSLIQGGSMNILVTIKNQGVNNSNLYDWAIDVGGSTICTGQNQTNSLTETYITCPWTTSNGFHKATVRIDINNNNSEDDENNNNYNYYIPFLNRPWFHFNQSEWDSTLKPYCDDSNNIISYQSCNTYKTFISEDFNNGWTGNNVDPRGKKGRENAMGCFYNGFPSSTQCTRARNHLFGWANRTVSGYSNVQAIHELVHVAIIYDLMFQNLTQAENELVTKQFHDICQHITTISNTQPYNDNDDIINGGNGKGFGSGMAGFCYGLIGSYKDNPSLMLEPPQGYNRYNIVDEWMDREESYLRAYKNQTWALYQEGWLYKLYSQYHLVENFWFEKRYNLINLSLYNNALCSMGREMVTQMLDYNYNGNTLRNDENRYFRAIQRGDTNSYEDRASGSIIDDGIITFYGLLCEDQEVKNATRYLRNMTYTHDSETYSLPEMYIYKQLVDQASITSPSFTFPKMYFDNANDIFTLRDNYTYTTDTIFMVDGGEERGGGHSQAQGSYLYALGEPFLDYEQVPYEDDTRMDVWKNGISFQNTTQTREGAGGYYKSSLGDYGYNQYYGNDGSAYYSSNYPDYRTFTLAYGGDLEDYIATNNADFGGVYVYRPYYNASNVKEYYVKYDDFLIKRTVTASSNENKVYHNFINLADEFNATISGTNLTLERSNKNLVVKLHHSTNPLSLGGGATNITSCYSKTSCSGSYRGNSNYALYQYYNKTTANNDFIISHGWYYDGGYKTSTIVNDASGDKGVLLNNSKYVVFDYSGDGTVSSGTLSTDGWALAYKNNTEIAAFNATVIDAGSYNILESNVSGSYHILRSNTSIKLTANTMDRDQYIDRSKMVRITLNTSDLTNRSNFTVLKNGVDTVTIQDQGTDIVIFDIATSLNSDYYLITASNASNATQEPGGDPGEDPGGDPNPTVSNDMCHEFGKITDTLGKIIPLLALVTTALIIYLIRSDFNVKAINILSTILALVVITGLITIVGIIMMIIKTGIC